VHVCACMYIQICICQIHHVSSRAATHNLSHTAFAHIGLPQQCILRFIRVWEVFGLSNVFHQFFSNYKNCGGSKAEEVEESTKITKRGADENNYNDSIRDSFICRARLIYFFDTGMDHLFVGHDSIIWWHKTHSYKRCRLKQLWWFRQCLILFFVA